MRAYINNKPFDFDQEITILEAARQMGFFIPTLCAFKPLCQYYVYFLKKQCYHKGERP